VWNDIVSKVGPSSEAHLTFFAHSAGSLVAHDFLFWLFSGKRDGKMGGKLPSEADFQAARTNWRLRRLVTFGAPIAPMMVRSAEVVAIMAADGSLNAAMIGLGQADHDGAMPKWVNVWDRHDVLSYPVGPFYHGGDIVDLYPDHSDSLIGSHDAYWDSGKVHRSIAEEW